MSNQPDPPHDRFGNPWPAIGGTPLNICLDIDRAPWADIDPKTVLHGQIERVGLLRNGTVQGRASVALLIRLDDGRTVIGETTWRLFNTAARSLAASPAAAEETP